MTIRENTRSVAHIHSHNDQANLKICNSMPFKDSKNLNWIVSANQFQLTSTMWFSVWFSFYFIPFSICIYSFSDRAHTHTHTRCCAHTNHFLSYYNIHLKVYMDVWGLLSPAASTLKHKRWTEICLNYIDRFKANHAISKLHQPRWTFGSIKREMCVANKGTHTHTHQKKRRHS